MIVKNDSVDFLALKPLVAAIELLVLHSVLLQYKKKTPSALLVMVES